MSGKCDNCDCTDSSQCVKKGNSIDIIETDKSYIEDVVMGVPAAESGGKCKCGTSCPCVNCTCDQ
ncbi:hypothetical protein Acr_17g0013150 [Actinidia rufa]|uniref:Metallothionein 3 n=1 Tax=Actinidia rufa TaxID=165716 RepID=A0A7J0G4M5_9ERIC|nr:hypothetical protein Acr_17g0013150 [Actinidia rufa]